MSDAEDIDRGFGTESDDSHWRRPHHHSFDEHHGGRDGSHEFHQHDHGGGLGWGPAAWGEAGGFEHILGGGLDGSLAIGPIDHLADISKGLHAKRGQRRRDRRRRQPGGLRKSVDGAVRRPVA